MKGSSYIFEVQKPIVGRPLSKDTSITMCMCNRMLGKHACIWLGRGVQFLFYRSGDSIMNSGVYRHVIFLCLLQM